MKTVNDIVVEIERHSVKGITECFRNGVNPNATFNGESLLYELTSEYTRSPRFKECVRAFVDHGLVFGDRVLLSVLLDDADTLGDHIKSSGDVVTRTYTLRCAYTPLYEASLLHICAEYNHVRCAGVLIEHGADVNRIAGTDAYGFGGQTPIFHTVNQNSNQSAEMMDLLLSKNADLSITVRGLMWGKGYEWETLIPSVNPISYAMMGLLPQMHRDEKTISDVVVKLLKCAYGGSYKVTNVPNRYLKQ